MYIMNNTIIKLINYINSFKENSATLIEQTALFMNTGYIDKKTDLGLQNILNEIIKEQNTRENLSVRRSQARNSHISRISKKEKNRIINKWNNIAKRYNLAKINDLTSTRQSKILNRIDSLNQPKLTDYKKLNIFFQHIEEAIENSDFLQGVTTDWRVTFDFFLQPSSFSKALEGAYNTNTNKQSIIKEDNIKF